jgi:hypothetical protein
MMPQLNEIYLVLFLLCFVWSIPCYGVSLCLSYTVIGEIILIQDSKVGALIVQVSKMSSSECNGITEYNSRETFVRGL